MTPSQYKNLISVIVLTYNEEKTIARTLDSILCQKCHVPFEIVLGDDCSTDNTRKICEEYAKRFPNIIQLMEKAPNKGVIDNYFDCLLACQGKYIADCAGDDFWVDPLKLEKEVTILENNPDVTLVHTDWMYYDEETKATTHQKIKTFKNKITAGKCMIESIVTQTNGYVIHLCSALYRTEIMRKAYMENTYLFRNKDFGCEDLQICFIMAYMGKIAYIPDITLYYSYGRTSASNLNNDKKQFFFTRKVTNLSYYLCKKYDINSKITYKYFQNRLFGLTMHAFRCKDKHLHRIVKKCSNDWQVQIPTKAKIANVIMSNMLTWNLFLYIRKIFVGIKHILRK